MRVCVEPKRAYAAWHLAKAQAEGVPLLERPLGRIFALPHWTWKLFRNHDWRHVFQSALAEDEDEFQRDCAMEPEWPQ